MPGIRLRAYALVALTALSIGCGEDASSASGPCDKARVALASLEQEGLSDRVHGLVEEFLAAARSAEEPTVLYQAMQVGDAHRGSNPSLTLLPSLQNMVRFCEQGSS